MNIHFQKAFDKLEHQRKQIVELIENLSEETYTTSVNGKWSIAQIMAHLLVSESMSVGYMKKKSLGIETLRNSGLKHDILSVVLKISQRGPFRYSAPKVVVDNTPPKLSLEEAIARWDKSRNDLREFLETISDKHSKRLIYKHPIAGMLNTKQALKFMYEHVNHHLPQILRLLKR